MMTTSTGTVHFKTTYEAALIVMPQTNVAALREEYVLQIEVTKVVEDTYKFLSVTATSNTWELERLIKKLDEAGLLVASLY